MKSLSHYYSEEVRSWQRRGRIETIRNIFGLFGKAFMKAAKVEIAVNGFRKTGIYPINTQTFSNSDFATKKSESLASVNLNSTGI